MDIFDVMIDVIGARKENEVLTIEFWAAVSILKRSAKVRVLLTQPLTFSMPL